MKPGNHKIYETSGGKVRRNKAVYVERDLDRILYESLIRDNCFLSVTGPRQTGKTSLIFGLADQLAKQKVKVITIDLLRSPGPAVEELTKGDDSTWWFRSLFEAIGIGLGIDRSDIISWHELEISNAISFTSQMHNFFKNFARKYIDDKILIVFDELDFLGELGYYTNEFLQGLQALHDIRDELKLSILMASVAHPALLLKAQAVSSFKIGNDYKLPDFSLEDEKAVRLWAEGLNIDDADERCAVCKKVIEQTGGQPFLTSWLLSKYNEALAAKGTADVIELVNDLIKYAHNPLGSIKHFNAPRDFIARREGYAFRVLDQYREILKKPVATEAIDPTVLAILYTTGLVKEKDGTHLAVRCPTYEKVFDEDWCIKTEQGFGQRDWYSPLYIPSYSKKSSINICLFNAGGTVGMVEHGNRMVPTYDEKEFFSIYPSLKNIANIKFVQMDPKDGANMYPEDWTRIAKAIYDRRNDGYDGFVVAHGTDTMAYTASAVAFALGVGLEFPVVFVGAQAPHNVHHGDALVNLSRACIIASQKIPEVVIVFGDTVLRAVRSEKLSDYHFQGFHSPTHKPLALITEQVEIQHDALLKKSNSGRIDFKAEFETQILQISQYPGFQPVWLENLIESGKIKGIIIESLGLGNLPTDADSKYNMLDFIEKTVNELEIPVIITSRYPISPEFANKYLPATAALQKGAISAGNMTSSAALTKFSWLLPQIEAGIKNNDVKKHLKLEEIKKQMSYSYIGEVDKMPVIK